MEIIQDVKDNDFTEFVNQVINPDTKEIGSFLIKARGGTGKSNLMKQIQAKLDENKIEYVTMAPTNVACININGTTFSCYDINISKYTKSIVLDGYNTGQFRMRTWLSDGDVQNLNMNIIRADIYMTNRGGLNIFATTWI